MHRTLHNTSSERSVFCNTLSNVVLLTRVQFDDRRGSTWHCIVGRNFGSFVTHGQPSCFVESQHDDVLIFNRDETLHLLLHWSLCHTSLQDAMSQAQLDSGGRVRKQRAGFILCLIWLLCTEPVAWR